MRVGLQLFEEGDYEGGRFTGTCAGHCDDVAAEEGHGESFALEEIIGGGVRGALHRLLHRLLSPYLHGCGYLKAHPHNPLENFIGQS